MLLAVMSLVSASANAQAVGDARPMQVTYAAQFAEAQLVFNDVRGYDFVSLHEADCLKDVGKPMLPTVQLRLALPEGMAVTGVTVIDAAQRDLEGEYNICPAQPPRRVSDPAGPNDFVAADAEAYASSEVYPAQLAEFSYQTDLAGQSIAVIRLHPLQYIASERRLRLCTSMQIRVDGVGGYTCGDYLPGSISEQGRAIYQRMLTGSVANPNDVELHVADVPPGPGCGVEPGQYDYVIITHANWVNAFQPLADWKTKKGIPTRIVTVDWIFNNGGYSGDNPSMLRAFVQDAHDSWGATFFLLGGDTHILPAHSRYVMDEWVPNDTYYADLDDDWTCEVHVGRASVRNIAAIDTFVNKVLTYEKNPPLTDYAATLGFFGFDLYTTDSREGQNCKEDIEYFYVPDGMTCRTEYDSEAGAHKSDTIGYMNQGSHLLNHIDHCGESVMGVGYVNHGELLGKGDMDNLYNGDRQGILYSIGCWPAAYDYSDCIAEHYVRDADGGGMAFVGNARYGWYSPYYSDYYSLRYDRCFFRSLFRQGMDRLGTCLSDHKNDAYSNDECYRYIFTELTLLGDPELPVWTADPQTLDVTHPIVVVADNPTAFLVTVQCGGDPVHGATVCVSKPGDVYDVQTTTYAGQTTIMLTAETPGTMYVTVTCHNHLSYEGQVEVIPLVDCVGDLDGDADTDQGDLGVLLGSWGVDNGGDLDGDGDTDQSDLGILLGDWGCTQP